MSSVVDTKYGKLEGESADGVHVFKGIPFAKPPVGKLRFRAPEAPESWSGVREAKEWGPCAPQQKIAMQVVGDIDEDCLYLNVFTPALDGKKRPVMYWIHGGGFMMGTGAGPLYDGTVLANRGDVVVVTVNYRLGALGYTHFGDLLDSDFPTDSNAGMLDQAAGLEWVRDNIEAFGGDPGNVTIFGESAGGMSVGALLGMPRAQGLFHKAIAQSGATNHCAIPEDAKKVAEKLLETLGIDKSSPEKLWEVPWEKLLEAQQTCATMQVRVGPKKLTSTGMVFIPVEDGEVFPEQIQNAVANGVSKDVAVMTGHTLEEWKLFSAIGQFVPKNADIPATFKPFLKMKDMDEAGLAELGEKFLPGHAADALKAYKKDGNLGSDAKPSDIFNVLMTDFMFRIPAIRLLEASGKHQPKSFMYRLDWQSPMPGFGACHAIDLPFVFGWTDHNLGKMFTGGGPKAGELSEKIQDAWLSFAKNGDPSHDGIPEWPAYDTDKRAVMVFNKECGVENAPSDELRKFWDDVL